MMKKVTFLAGIGVGYLIGSKAGREKLMQLWNDPKVQDTVQQGTEWAKEKAPVLQEKAGDVVGSAKEAAKDTAGQAKEGVKGGSSDSGSGASSARPSAASTGAASAGAASTGSSSAGAHTTGGDKPMDPAHPQPETGR